MKQKEDEKIDLRALQHMEDGALRRRWWPGCGGQSRW